MKLMTSESVTEGHPDKICDRISDAILDRNLTLEPDSRSAIETTAAGSTINVFGETTALDQDASETIVRQTLAGIGYNPDDFKCNVSLRKQSKEIAQGIDRPGHDRYHAQGAGDQGVMFGYACDETDVLMPMPIHLAHRLAYRLAQVRKRSIVPYLRPDGKTQVTIEYDGHGRPVRVDTVLVSTQHDPEATREWLSDQLTAHVIRPVLDEVCGGTVAHDDYRLLVNPTGSFVLGGPAADAGLTGRKIIVDTYGGAAHHGGGAFSGKDPSKVDRSAAYAARWVAKNIVAAGLAHKVEVQVAYAIGVADPVSINVDTYGTEQGVNREQIQHAVREVFDLRPAAIIDELDLLRPIYAKTAAYGHFGREDADFTWERTDKVEALKAAIR